MLFRHYEVKNQYEKDRRGVQNKDTVTQVAEVQGQQYTNNELASVMIKTMFSTFKNV